MDTVQGNTLRFGNITVRVLNDGYWRSDGGAMFGVVPRTLWSRRLPPDDRNRVPMAIRSLLVQTPDATILVDTGLGDKMGEKEREIFAVERPVGLIGELDRLGVKPEDVDIVLNTHLHLDHAGGNTIRKGERLIPAFPRAEYWTQRQEWQDATHPNERTRITYLLENLEPVAESGRLRLFDGEREIVPGVRWLLAPGHTRAHTCVQFEAGDRSALYTVDVCPYVSHLERISWVAAVDVEPLVSMETKRRIVHDLLDHDRLVIFDHDPEIAVGRLARREDSWSVVPVSEGGDG